MPVYEYMCRCGHRFEELVRGGADVSCPECEARDAVRLPSRFVAGSSPRRERPGLASVPFERASCCGGACRGHAH